MKASNTACCDKACSHADNLSASNQILRDALAAQQANHIVEVARIRAEMAPGFSWPDPDGVSLLLNKIDAQRAEMVKMAARMTKSSVEHSKAKAEIADLRGENAELRAALAAERGGNAYKLDRITAERDALRALYANPNFIDLTEMAAKLAKVTAERDDLRRRYAHHNTAGKNQYTERRSQVNEDLKRIEAEIIEDMGTTLDAEREKAAAGNDATRSEGQEKGHAGHSHSNKPDEKIWYTRTQCPHCQRRGCLMRKKTRCKLISEFFEDRMWLKTTCHIGVVYDCAACGRVVLPNLPGIPGTSFGKKALSFIVQLAGRKNVDADIAEIFGDMFDFETGKTTMWNARCAAANMLEHTMKIIKNVLRNAKYLGIDETYFSNDGESGYVWVVRSDKVTLVLAMPSRGGDVIEKHMSDLLHIPVTTDGHAPYLSHFKILQRCWAHILRAAEEAYVLLDRGDPKRYYYRELYLKLLQIFRDAKHVAAKTKNSGGADHATCAKFEERVRNLVPAYGNHKFATTLEGAAPKLFTFLRYPGMPPTNNDTERDIRDAVVVQRKIRRRFVNARGMHVFSVLQSFNSTCRKLGLVPWKCMEQIIDDQKYNILHAGEDVKRASTPWRDAKPVTYQLYADGKAVETRGAKLNGDIAAALTAEAKGGLETECHAQEVPVPETNAETGVEPLSQTHLTDFDRPPPTQPCALRTTRNKKTTPSDTSSTMPYHRKPPPTITA